MRWRSGATSRPRKHADDVESVVAVTAGVDDDDDETGQGRLRRMVTVFEM